MWEWQWWAYKELLSERQVGMDAGKIPHSVIEAFATTWNLYGYERLTLLHVIRGLEAHQAIKREEELARHKQLGR